MIFRRSPRYPHMIPRSIINVGIPLVWRWVEFLFFHSYGDLIFSNVFFGGKCVFLRSFRDKHVKFLKAEHCFAISDHSGSEFGHVTYLGLKISLGAFDWLNIASTTLLDQSWLDNVHGHIHGPWMSSVTSLDQPSKLGLKVRPNNARIAANLVLESFPVHCCGWFLGPPGVERVGAK